MISRIYQHPFTRAVLKKTGSLQQRVPAALGRRRILGAAIIACLLAALYWSLIASDRYVSEARVIIQRTDLSGAQSMDFGSLLAGTAGVNRTDQLLLRDYLLSSDVLAKLDSRLNLRAHYSSRSVDPLSRMWSAQAPQEWFHRYYLSRVSVELDDYAGVLVIKAEGYDATTAHAIAASLVEEGERKMNAMAHQLAREQLGFVEKQVALMAERFEKARQELIAFQNKKGMVSPQSTAENLVGTINRLDSERTELQAKRNTLLGYLAPRAPGVVELDLQLAAIEKQIAKEQARLTAPAGKTLNSTVEQYQRLEMAEKFAQDVYKTALVALEKGRVEATRTIKKVSVLQAPTVPEYPLEPQRVYNIVVFVLVTLIIAGIVHLLAAIIRDHKD